MAFIRLADLIINVDCIATVEFSTYKVGEHNDIPIVNLCLTVPAGSLHADAECGSEKCQCRRIEKLEFESELAMAIWNYFQQSGDVTVLFE